MIRIRGEVTVHALRMTIPYVYEAGTFTLGVNLKIPDHEIRRIAIWVAELIERPVIWQDIVGRLHQVQPNGKISELVVFVDPRSHPNRRNRRPRKK